MITSLSEKWSKIIITKKAYICNSIVGADRSTFNFVNRGKVFWIQVKVKNPQ